MTATRLGGQVDLVEVDEAGEADRQDRSEGGGATPKSQPTLDIGVHLRSGRGPSSLTLCVASCDQFAVGAVDEVHR
jgi:hypothetical protein